VHSVLEDDVSRTLRWLLAEVAILRIRLQRSSGMRWHETDRLDEWLADWVIDGEISVGQSERIRRIWVKRNAEARDRGNAWLARECSPEAARRRIAARRDAA
jgi:hypothetical protein